MEHPIAVPPSLEPIEEHQVLQIDPDAIDEIVDNDGSVSDDERTSLLRSGHLSYSYTESIGRYIDTHEQEYQKAFEVSSNEDNLSTDNYEPSIMTEFQASYFLPSLLISSYSTVRQSYDQMARSMAQSMIKRSLYGSKSIAVSLVERLSDDRGASFALSLFNLLPYLLGSALFTLPYALVNGGYVAIPAFLIMSMLANYTTLLLVDAMYETSPKSKKRKRTKLDYVEIAMAAFGTSGARLLNVVLLSYLFSSNVIVLVLIGKSCYAILKDFTSLSSQAIMAIFSVLVIPTLFIKKLSHLAYLSMISTLAICVGGLATAAVFIFQHENWENNLAAIPVFRWNGFALSLSIWSYTLITHCIVPQVEASMQQPSKFKKATFTVFGISTPVKILYSLMGALAYGAATNSLITDNIIEFSYPVSVVANVAVFTYAVLNFPLNFFVVCDAFDSKTLGKKYVDLRKGGKYHYVWILMTRPILVAIGLGIGLVVPYFGLLVGVLGSLLGTLIVFLFPCIFHLKLKWKVLCWYEKAADIIAMSIGCVVGSIGLYASVRGLYLAIRHDNS